VKLVFVAALVLSVPLSAIAQEHEDFSIAFARVKGGAVYDEKIGLDGSLVTEEYVLTHVTCTDGSKKLRVMLPLGLEDNDTFFTLDGEPSSLTSSFKGFTVKFKLGKRKITKVIALKPVNDVKSHYKQQFELSLNVGDPLWSAMRDSEAGKALMLIGTGGTPVSLPTDATFEKFLKSCGISVPH
jgi:hypothetical protein